jgi:hypothetical protein
MLRKLVAVLLLVVLAAVLGATVFRENIASAASATLSVFVTNDTAHPVPVREQGTVTVQAPISTQLLLNQVVTDNQRQTVDVSAYKTVHIDFNLVSGNCFGSGARLDALETSDSLFLQRVDIGADEACTSGFTGKTIEMPGRTLTLIPSIPTSGDRWRIVVFGRAN